MPDAASRPWPEQTFAEEAARSQDGRTILFRVSRELAEIAGDKFYDPVRFRFVERADGTYEMECQRVEQ